MSSSGNTPSTSYTTSYTSIPTPSSPRSSRTRRPKRSDSLETIRPTSPKLPQSTRSNPTSIESARSKSSKSSKPSKSKSTSHARSSSKSSSKSAEKQTRPLSVRRYSAEGLWKGVSKSTSTEGSNSWFEAGVTRSSSPSSESSSSLSSSSSSSSSSGSESRGRKTHRRSHEAYGIGLGLPSTRTAQGDNGSRDVTPRVSGNGGPQKSASCSQLTSGNGYERRPTTSISMVSVQATLFEPQHRTKEGDESKGESASMEGGSEDRRTSPRLPLRVVNDIPLSTSPEPVEDEFVDVEVDSDEQDTSVPIHIEGSRSRSVSPKTGHGDDWSDENNSDNDFFEVLPPKWRRRAQTTAKDSSRSSDRADPKAPRVSLRIKPRENHVTFWDAKDGDDLLVKGRLELTDRLLETRCHYAEIYVHSFVGSEIRSIEHMGDPEFVLHYKDTDSQEDNGPFKSSRQVDLEETDRASKNGTSGLPSWAKAALEDEENDNADKDKPRITTYHWAQSIGGEVPMWVKYFTVPIPARLFDSRETRVFRIEAKVGYFSAIPTGEYREVGAPITQVSVTHLSSSRELGIWDRAPPRNTFVGFP